MSTLLSDFNATDRINSNVARTRLYSDLNLSLLINPITRDISPVTDIDAVKNSIKNLMLTSFHERPFQPTIGAGLTALLFENANIFTTIELENAIKKTINIHEPRVTDLEIEINDDIDRNAYAITVKFRVFYDNTINELDFFLTRLR
jgi:phage baseplate assembly protein W